ncbi:MAG: homoserine O-succinyltransferase [Rhodopila sp.]
MQDIRADIPIAGDRITIGLINNMPDAALRATERQFQALVAASPMGRQVRLRSFFLPDIPRSDRAWAYLHQYHEPVADLWDSRVDGLIVTGTEPRTAALTDEPYWDSLAQVVDWAEDHTVSTIWSCLAAHAVVLHLHGVHRRRLDVKLSGIFACRQVQDHPILADVPAAWRMPHSRQNGLPEGRLDALGYQMLSLSDTAGADVFIRQRGSLFVFFQGHPEYDRLALFREYRRDIRRFLSGERDTYPDLPVGYFDAGTTEILLAFRSQAMRQRRATLLDTLPIDVVGVSLMHSWHDPAVRIFSNWLSYVAAHRPQYMPGSTCASLGAQLPGSP